MSISSPQNKQASRLQFLNELSTRLQSLIQTEDFYSQIVSIISSKFDYDSIHIWSIDPTTREVILEAQTGEYSPHLPIGYKIPVEKAGIMKQAIYSRKSYLCNEVQKDPNFTNLSLPVQSQSELCIPVVQGQEVVATLNVESDQTFAFDETDIVTLESVAAQLTVAIANRRLFKEALEFGHKLQHVVEDKTKELREAHSQIVEQQKLLERENKALKNLVRKEHKTVEIIGKSPAIVNVLTMVDKIAPTTATVLIQGESGTGKELIAKRLHSHSERAEKAYVTVNCGALQESLLESELFGHEKGAFTGALQQKTGLAEMADGGTLFLDEIGELSPAIQTKLLRFLQEGEFYRIGGKKPIQVDVRIVSATNRDLEREVREGRFREDLYYRLNTITLRTPPLRERKEDIAPLVQHFLEHSKNSNSPTIKKIDPKTYEIFTNYEWPGNIRELQNTIERIRILCDNNEIRVEDIPFEIRNPKSRETDSPVTGEMTLEILEKNHILRTLDFFEGNKTRTAQSLGITAKTLYNKLERYGLMPQKPGLTLSGDSPSTAESQKASSS